MACLQIARSGFSPTIHLRPNLPVRRRAVGPLVVPVHSSLQQGNGDSNGEEPPESLFMKELKRRGVTPSSLLQDAERALYRQGQEDVAAEEENGAGRGRPKRNGVASAEYEKSASGQREVSMALNSEGIEEKEEAFYGSMIGSRPPPCQGICRECGHCEAVQVPLFSQQRNVDGEFSSLMNRREDESSNYKPLSWKCKCGDVILYP